jgi:DNA-binding MarR family transcriptional regulator
LNEALTADLSDDFPDSPARRAVVAVVRGFGAVQRAMGPYFAHFGLTPPQFQMLTVINRLRCEPLTQRRLARELYVSFPNITVMLARLEEAGLVRRRANPADGREKFVEITSAGKKLLRQIWKVHQQQLEHVVRGLADSERLDLARLLNKLIAAHAPPAATQGGTKHGVPADTL